MDETKETSPTMEQVFNQAVEEARFAWTKEPWKAPRSIIDSLILEEMRAIIHTPEYKARANELAISMLLEPDALPATVKQNVYSSSWDRDFNFRDIVKNSIKNNEDKIDAMLSEFVTTNGQKVVEEMFRDFVRQAAAQAAGSFAQMLLGAVGDQTRMAIQNTMHITR